MKWGQKLTPKNSKKYFFGDGAICCYTKLPGMTGQK